MLPSSSPQANAWLDRRSLRGGWCGGPPAAPESVVMPTEIAKRGPDTEAIRSAVVDVLLEMSIGIHRHAMYPTGHPSLSPVAAELLARLDRAFGADGFLRLGVLRDRFIEGESHSDPRHPILSELAARIHDHEVAWLEFRRGVAAGELRSLLGLLAAEIGRGARPLGTLPADKRPEWPHITVEALHYDALVLAENGATAGSGSAELWESMLRSASGASRTDPDRPAGEALAAAVREGSDDALQMSLVAGYLAPLLESLSREPTSGAGGDAEVREELAGFLTALGPEARAELLRTGGDAAWRMDLVRAASRSLDLEGLLGLVDAAAAASGKPISNSMTRLLTKMATHEAGDDPASRRRADESVRENVISLLRDWTLADPNPDAYSGVLDALSRGEGGQKPTLPDPSQAEVALRVLTVSVEVGHWTHRSEAALRAVLDAGRLGDVYRIVDGLASMPGVDPLRGALREPVWVRRAVSSETLESAGVARLALEAGPRAIPALMDGLIAGRTRETRRTLFDTLAHLGAPVIPEIEARLPTPHWFVARNLLSLLAVLPEQPSSIDILQYLRHDDRRVRRAAFPVAIRDPERAEAALLTALGDRDERVAQLALLHLDRAATDAVIRAVVSRVVLAGRSAELRVLGVRALRGRTEPLVRDALVELATRGLNAPPAHARAGGALALAALQVLVPQWPEDAGVCGLHRAARAAADPTLRIAAEAL